MAEEMFKTTLMGGFDKDDVQTKVQIMKDEAYAEKSKLIKAGKEKLMQSAQKLFAKVYEQSQAGGAAGAGPDMGGAAQGGSEAGYGDDVVDADYKEV